MFFNYTFFLIFSNAIECSLSQLKTDFLFKRGRRGFPRVARFAKKLIKWFIEAEIDHKFLKLQGIRKLLIAKVLSSNGGSPC